MRFFERHQWLFMIMAIFVGLGLGQVETAGVAERFILPFLMVMVFGVFLQVPLARLREGFRSKRLVALSLIVNFLWTPLLAFGLARLFFRDAPDVFLAMLMDMVTPCTDWYLVFTGIAGGHLAVSAALLPWNLLLQLVLLPVYLLLFAGAVVEIQPQVILLSFLKALLAPFFLAVVARNIILRAKGQDWFQGNVLGRVSFLQALFLHLAILSMFASQGAVLIQNAALVLRLIVPVAIFFSVNFALGQLLSRVFRLPYRDGVSLIITVLARNAPLALTIAVAAFPDRPLIPLVLAVESMIELPMLFVLAQVLLLIRRRNWWPDPT